MNLSITSEGTILKKVPGLCRIVVDICPRVFREESPGLRKSE